MQWMFRNTDLAIAVLEQAWSAAVDSVAVPVNPAEASRHENCQDPSSKPIEGIELRRRHRGDRALLLQLRPLAVPGVRIVVVIVALSISAAAGPFLALPGHRAEPSLSQSPKGISTRLVHRKRGQKHITY
uniref:Uncharacterized protein n=2 Tax=Oryza TaxID=4527 RepID=A0A0E0CF62_9ORYZ